MSAGTLTLTNNSAAVAGNGTAFTTEVAAGDFIVVTVGGVPYTLPIKSVESGTALTLVSNFTGPTQSGAAWSAVPRVALNMVTAALVAQSAEALRGLNYDKQNWQSIFSGSGDATVKLPDGSSFTGPAWGGIAQTLNDLSQNLSQRLEKDKNLSDLTDTSKARQSLELGDSATHNIGEADDNVLAVGSFGVGSKNLPVISDLWDKTRGTRFFNVNPSTSGGTGTYGSGLRLSDRNVGSGSPVEQQAFVAIIFSGKAMQFMSMADGINTGWMTVYHTGNTTRSADGTLKAASPIIKIYADGRFDTNDESEGCTVTRVGTGEYRINGCIGMNADAAWGGVDGGFDIPKDRNRQPLVWLDYEVDSEGSVLVKTFHRTYPDSPPFARNERPGLADGDPVDIPADQFVSVRVEMPQDSIWNKKQKEMLDAMKKAERERQQNQQQEQV